MQTRLTLFLVFCCITCICFAQEAIILPDASQKASTAQRIGLTDINVAYHSPGVKGRAIWGKLVPFGEVWRCGANENTVISFSTDVLVDGQTLAAGSYGLHMLPTQKNWTVIFSKNTTSWGSYHYDKAEDALQIWIKPDSLKQSVEWLNYTFTDRSADKATLALQWEHVQINIPIAVDLPKTVISSVNDQLRGAAGFFWYGAYQAADYSLKEGIALESGQKWLEQSIQTNENFTNLALLSHYQAKQNKPADAAATLQKAYSLANEGELLDYAGYAEYEGHSADQQSALEAAVKRFPDSYRPLFYAGKFYYSKDKPKGNDYFKKALLKVPADKKASLEGAIDKVKSN